MSFQILDQYNNPVPINALDEQAAKIWGVPLVAKSYAVPFQRHQFPQGLRGSVEYADQINWFDSIGWAISFKKCTTWNEVRTYLREYWDSKGFTKVSFNQLEPNKGKLIDYWEGLGYSPKYIE